MVKSGDTLESLARKHKIGSETVRLMNCLVTETLLPGSMIYLPPIPTATKVPCGAPAGWILYTVQPGDNLYRLSRAYGITVADLQKANCMGTSTIIITGKKLYVPPWPPIYPTPTEYYMPEPTWTESYFPTESYTPTNIP